MKLVRQLLAFFKRWFWINPTEKAPPQKAEDVIDQYTVINYKGQNINLKKDEVVIFNAMARSDKRAMAKQFAIQQKKGNIKFQEINGKMTCIKVNKHG